MRPIKLSTDLCYQLLWKNSWKIIFKNLYNYVTRNRILSDHQSGFRTKDSTINQLLIIYNTIIKNLDLGKDVRFIFCDISKAFDRVWHSGLIFKLRKYGICGNVLKWIESFLHAFDRVWHFGLIFKLRKYGICGNVLKWNECFLYDRKQRVNVDGYFSRWKTVNAGYSRGPHLALFYSHYSLTTLRMRSQII